MHMPSDVSAKDAMFSKLDALSPLGYAGAFRLRFGRALFYRITYDPDWSQYYGEHNFALCDPAAIWGVTHTGFIRWSELRLPDLFGVFNAARRFGYTYGLTVSCGPPTARTIVGFARGDREFSDEEARDLEDVVKTIHDLIADATPLSEQQIEALRLFSQGYDYDEISATIGISRTTLKYRLGGARKRLGARSNVDAVRIATEQSILNPHPYTGTIR